MALQGMFPVFTQLQTTQAVVDGLEVTLEEIEDYDVVLTTVEDIGA